MKSSFVLFFVLLCFILSGIFCGKQTKKSTEKSSYLNLSDSVHYAGMQQCRQCHENIYQTFIQTGMGKSFEKSSRKKSSGKFDRHALVYDKNKDFYYKPYWDRDSLKIMEFRLKGRDTIYKRIQAIQYIIGSGQHTNSHIYKSGNYLFQAPLTFYTQDGKWDLPPGFENGSNSRFSRIIGLECLSCHNAYPSFVEGSENKYTEVPQGIDCERCHGPGSLHIKEKKDGKIVDISKEIDYTIVNPGKMPVEMQFEICQRCHLQGNAVLKEGRSFYDFRPGMKLSDVMYVFMPQYKGSEKEFIMASHVERLKMSKCYLNTHENKEQKNGISCISCHNPHISVRFTDKEVFNNTCRKCHSNTSENAVLCGADIKERKLLNDNCVNCHMVKSGTIDIPHVVSTDHYIRIPTGKNQVEAEKRFVRLACINEPNPPKEEIAKAYINYYEKFTSNKSFLDSAENYLSIKNSSDIKKFYKTLVHLAYLKEDYNRIIQIAEKVQALSFLSKKSWSNEDAYALYRTGDAYFNMGMMESARPYLLKAIELAPFIPEFKNRYGSLLMNTGNSSGAKLLFEEIHNESRNFVPAISNLGYSVLINNKNILEAMSLYDLALSLDPDYESAILNKAGLYIYQQNFSLARKILNKYAEKNPANKQVQDILASIKNMKDK